MDPMIGSALISGGSDLLGGLFGSKGPSAKDAYKMGDAQRRNATLMARSLPKAQMEGWKAAGIHPLAGLGMSMPSSSGMGSFGGDNTTGQAISDLGQGVSRAISAYSSREERALDRKSKELTLENQELQNARLRSEITLMSQPGTPPGVNLIPDEQVMSKMGGTTSAGTHPMWMEVMDTPGRTMVIPRGDNPAESMESLFGAIIAAPQMARNRINDLYDRIREIRKSR